MNPARGSRDRAPCAAGLRSELVLNPTRCALHAGSAGTAPTVDNDLIQTCVRTKQDSQEIRVGSQFLFVTGGRSIQWKTQMSGPSKIHNPRTQNWFK